MDPNQIHVLMISRTNNRIYEKNRFKWILFNEEIKKNGFSSVLSKSSLGIVFPIQDVINGDRKSAHQI